MRRGAIPCSSCGPTPTLPSPASGGGNFRKEELTMAKELPSTPTLPRKGGGESMPPKSLGLALAVIAVAQLMVVLDTAIVNIALPSIQRALHFTPTGLEWVVNGYALAFGGLLLLTTHSSPVGVKCSAR